MSATYQIPLLVTSNVKVYRVTTLPPSSGQPLFVFDGHGNRTPNPDSMGPIGWYRTGFDDSTWATPVLTDGSDPGVTPLHYALPGGTLFGGRMLEGTVDGDPFWITATESNPDAALLVRWRFTPSTVVAGSVVGFFQNVGNDMAGPTFGYLNLTSSDGVDEFGIGDVLGQDLLSGIIPPTDPPFNVNRLGRIVPGVENLLAYCQTYHGWSFTTGNVVGRNGHTSTFYLGSLVFAIAPVALGRSSVQFIG